MNDDPWLQAHPAPDPTLSPDSVRRDMAVVAFAIAVLIVLALVAAGWPPR